MITLPVSNLAMVINALVVLAYIAFFAWRGYQRGVLRILQRMISVLSGYVACYLFTGALADFLKTILTLNIFLSYLLSATLLLVGVSFAVDYFLSRFLARNDEESINEDEASNLHIDEEQDQRTGYNAGMAVGVALGIFLGLLTVWLAGISIDAITLNRQGPAVLSARSVDPVRKAAGNMVGGAVGYVVEQKTGRESLAPDLIATLVADPVAMSQQIAEITKRDEIKQFFSDKSAQALMQENKIDELQKHETFQRLINTPETKVFFGVLGSAVKDGEKMTQESRAAHLLTDMYLKARRVQTDPRFIALSQKPEYQQLIQHPSPGAIFTSPLIKELGDIIFSSAPPVTAVVPDHFLREGTDQHLQSVEKPTWEKVETITQDASPAATSVDESISVDDSNVIYRWTDEHGQKHFSQTKPQGDYPVEVIKSQ